MPDCSAVDLLIASLPDLLHCQLYGVVLCAQDHACVVMMYMHRGLMIVEGCDKLLDCLAAWSADLVAASLLCCRTAPLWKCTACEGSCAREHDIHAATGLDGLRGLTSSALPFALV